MTKETGDNKKYNIEKSRKLVIILVLIGICIGIIISVSYSILQTQERANKLSHLDYSNTKYWFGLNPPTGWTIDESGQDGGAVNFKYITTEGYTVILDIDKPHKFSAGQALEDVVQQTIIDINDNYPDSILISNSSRVVNGMNGYEIIYSIVIQNDNITGKQVFVEKEDMFYYITYTANESIYEEYLDDIEESINSFTIV